MLTTSDQLAVDAVAWQHNVAHAEGGVLALVADSVARSFSPGDLSASAVRRGVRAAVAAAVERLKGQLAAVYDATRTATHLSMSARTPTQLRFAEAAVKTRGVVAYTPDQAAERVERLTRRGSWASGVAKITRAAEARAAEVLAASVGAGLLPGQVETALENAVGGRASWQGFVRTELQRVNNLAVEDSFQANRDLLRGKQFVATLDTRTCPRCSALDGEVFAEDPQDGERQLSEAPEVPLHDRCRCTYTVVVRSADDISRRTGLALDPNETSLLDGKPAKRMTYDQWLAGVDEETQARALGPARMELYRAGVPINRFVDDDRALTAEELRAGADSLRRVASEAAIEARETPAGLVGFVDFSGRLERSGEHRVAPAGATPPVAPSSSATVGVSRVKPATLKRGRPAIEVSAKLETIRRIRGKVDSRNRDVGAREK